MNTIYYRMNSIDYRIKRFQDLHNNKWFNIMNYNLHMILLRFDKKEQYMLKKYGSCFYF